MKFIIRSSDHGQRIPAAVIDEKKKAARAKVLAAGLQYLEYSALLGSENAQGQEIEEEVTVLEAVSGVVYV